MADQPDNLVLVFLRRLDAKLDALAERVDDLRSSVRTVEAQMGSLSQYVLALSAAETEHHSLIAKRLDRLTDRVERIERRLDLVGTP